MILAVYEQVAVISSFWRETCLLVHEQLTAIISVPLLYLSVVTTMCKQQVLVKLQTLNI